MRQVTLMKKLLFFDIDGTLVDFGTVAAAHKTAEAAITAILLPAEREDILSSFSPKKRPRGNAKNVVQ